MTRCSNKCIYEPGCKGAWQEDCSGPVFAKPTKKEPTHCSKCGAKLKPSRMSPGPPGSGRRMLGGWYTVHGSKDPLCPACVNSAVSRVAIRRIPSD